MNPAGIAAWLLTEAGKCFPRDADGRLAYSKEAIRVAMIVAWILTFARMCSMKIAADALPYGISIDLSVPWGWCALVAFTLTGLVMRIDNAQREREVAKNGNGGTPPPAPPAAP